MVLQFPGYSTPVVYWNNASPSAAALVPYLPTFYFTLADCAGDVAIRGNNMQDIAYGAFGWVVDMNSSIRVFKPNGVKSVNATYASQKNGAMCSNVSTTATFYGLSDDTGPAAPPLSIPYGFRVTSS